MQGAAPSPSSLARLWGSLLLFPSWGLGQVVFGQSQRLREAERARCSLQQAKDGMGALQRGLGEWGTLRAEAETCPAVLAVPCHTQCHVTLSPMLPGDHDAPGQQQLCMPCSVFQEASLPAGMFPAGAREGGRQHVGNAVAQTLMDVMVSYFKILSR